MRHLDSYEKYNEGWKNILATALIGLTTACQKPDLEDEFGQKLPTRLNDLAKVTFVDSLSRDKFRIEAKLSDDRTLYFDNSLRLDTGQTIYLHNDDIGRLLVTPVSDDFEIPESKFIELKINSKGEISPGIFRSSKVKIAKDKSDELVKNLKSVRKKYKATKWLSVHVGQNGNILDVSELKSPKSFKPQQNWILLRGLQ